MADLMNMDADEFAFKYPSWACRVSTGTAVDGSGITASAPPTLKSEISTQLKPVKVSVSAGGQQMDYADLVWMVEDALINRTTQPAKFTKMLDVIFPSNPAVLIEDDEWFDEDGPNRRVLLGDYTEEAESVDQEEILTGRVELRPYLFGHTFDGMRFKNNRGSGVITVVGTDAVLNPMVDGVVLGNMSDFQDGSTNVWIDPEVALTTYATDYHEHSGTEWTLIKAIKTICFTCNGAEKLIANPIFDEEAEIWENVPVIKDLRMKSGRYLPSYLDELLHPLGFNWYTDPDQGVEIDNETQFKFNKPRIMIMRKGYQVRGDGSRASTHALKFQAPGETLDTTLSDVNAYDIRRRIGDSITAVRTLGDKLRAEMTLRLWPCWKADSDSLTVSDLTIDGGSSYEANQHVHRLWIAGEGGDLYGMRTEEDLYYIDDTPDFDDIFGICKSDDGTEDEDRYASQTIHRRRVIEPPLTFKGTATERVRRDLLLQYSIDGGETWIEVTTKIGSWAVLGDRIGVIFTDNAPPKILVDAFASGDLQLRITGTIASDHSLYNVGADGYTTGSAQGRKNLTTLDMPDRFRHWFVVGQGHPDRPELDTSPYKSVLADDDAGADVHDDRAAIIQFSKDIIKPMLNAEYDGNFSIPGWTIDFKIGDLLTNIAGREISLDQSADEENPQYMQVTGIDWELSDEGGPQTRLTVDRGVREFVDSGFKRSSGSQALKRFYANMGKQTATQKANEAMSLMRSEG